MGPPENPTNLPQNQGTTPCQRRKQARRRPRMRRCLLKGCENRYRPWQARQRYCSAACREAARAWSGWKAQQEYRATPNGKEKRRAQSRRYRERVRSRQPQVVPPAEAAARVITKNFFRSFLRPARLLRRIRAPPPITAPALLLEGVPRGDGARLGAGTALAGSTGRTPNRTSGSAPALEAAAGRREGAAWRDKRDILTALRRFT